MPPDPEQKLERDIAEFEERVDKLEDSIGQAKDASKLEDVAGTWQGMDDQAGGEDPVGAHEEPDEPAEDAPPR